MSGLEVLALLFAILVLVKLIVGVFAPSKWVNITKKLLKGSLPVYLIYVVLAAIVGYLLFNSLTVIEVGAVGLFVSLLMAISFLPYASKLAGLKQEVNEGFMKKSWLAILIWAVLSIWIILEVIS